MQRRCGVSPVDKYTSHRTPVHMNTQYRLVETHNPSNATKAPLHDKHNAAMSEKPAKLWYQGVPFVLRLPYVYSEEPIMIAVCHLS